MGNSPIVSRINGLLGYSIYKTKVFVNVICCKKPPPVLPTPEENTIQDATNILYQAKCPSRKTKAPLRPYSAP